MKSNTALLLTDLPSETLLLILMFLDFLDVWKNVRLTCRRFRDIATAQRTYNSITLSWKMNLFGARQFFASKTIWVNSLTLTGPILTQKRFDQRRLKRCWQKLIPNVRSVKEICVTGTWYIDTDMVNLLASNFEVVKHLHTLNINYREIDDVKPVPWKPTKLRIIHVHTSQCMERYSVVPFICNSTHSLQYLKVTDQNIKMAIEDLPDAIKASQATLRCLDLYYHYTSNALLASIVLCKNLTYVRLNGCEPNQSLYFPALAHLRQLKTLILDLVFMSNVTGDLIELLHQFPPTCTVFHLEYEHFDDALLRAVALCGDQFEELKLCQHHYEEPNATTAGFAAVTNSLVKITYFNFEVSCKRSSYGQYPRIKNDNIQYLHALHGDVFLTHKDIAKLSKNLRAAFCGDIIYVTADIKMRELKKKRERVNNNWNSVVIRFI